MNPSANFYRKDVAQSSSNPRASASRTSNRLPGKSPFDLLNDFGNGDCNAGKLFIEFAYCFKGKRQLFWSRGLRQKLGISILDKSDEEISRNLVTVVDAAHWKLILINHAQWLILEIAKQGKDAVQRLLKRLANRTLAMSQKPRPPYTNVRTP